MSYKLSDQPTLYNNGGYFQIKPKGHVYSSSSFAGDTNLRIYDKKEAQDFIFGRRLENTAHFTENDLLELRLWDRPDNITAVFNIEGNYIWFGSYSHAGKDDPDISIYADFMIFYKGLTFAKNFAGDIKFRINNNNVKPDGLTDEQAKEWEKNKLTDEEIKKGQKFIETVLKLEKAKQAGTKACEKAAKEAREFAEKQKTLYANKFSNLDNPWDDNDYVEQYVRTQCFEASAKAFRDYVKGFRKNGIGGSGKATGPRQVISARLSEQAALMLNIERLINNKIDKKSRKEINYRNYSVTRIEDTGHSPITSLVTKHEAMNFYFNKIPTNIFSMLVPSIKIYKVFYPELHKYADDQKPPIKKDDLNNKFLNALKKPYHWRVPFDDVPAKYRKQTSEVVNYSVDDILNGNGTLHTVGIKSFNYEFAGNNPASSKAVVKAKIKLFFENPVQLTKNYDIKVVHGKDELKYTFCYSDLINWGNKNNLTGEQKNLPNVHYYRIKLVCGYGDIDDEIIRDTLTASKLYVGDNIENIINIIKQTKIIMYLSPWGYNVSFQENGAVELDIDYTGNIESVMVSKEADIFYISTAANKAILLQSYLELINSKKDLTKDPKRKLDEQETCSLKETEKKLLELQSKAKQEFKINLDVNKADTKKLEKQIINLKKESYNSIFSKIMGYSGRGREPTTHTHAGLYSAYIKTGLIELIGADKKETKDTWSMPVGNSNDVKEIRFENLNNAKALLRNSIPRAKGKKAASGEADLPKMAEQKSKEIEEKKPEIKRFGSIAYTKIRYFYLGDILDAALECLRNINPKEEIPRVILGEIPIYLPKSINMKLPENRAAERKELFVNLADVPVSYDLFQKFFIDNVVGKQRDRYPVFEFIRDVLDTLIFPALSPRVLDDGSAFNTKINYSVLNMTLPAKVGDYDLTTHGKDAGKKKGSGTVTAISKSATATSSTIKANLDPIILKPIDIFDEGVIINKELLEKIRNVSNERINIMEINPYMTTVNYMFLYCSSVMPFLKGPNLSLAQIENADIKNGIYHAKLGTDTGIVKKINFTKSDVPYQREAVARTTGKNLGTTIKQVFNADITMFGNNIYYPGDYIYINPLYAFGSGDTAGQIFDLQSSLGIGGYYMILKVNTVISDSNFETKLNCVFQASLESVQGQNYRRVDPYQTCPITR